MRVANFDDRQSVSIDDLAVSTCTDDERCVRPERQARGVFPASRERSPEHARTRIRMAHYHATSEVPADERQTVESAKGSAWDSAVAVQR